MHPVQVKMNGLGRRGQGKACSALSPYWLLLHGGVAAGQKPPTDHGRAQQAGVNWGEVGHSIQRLADRAASAELPRAERWDGSHPGAGGEGRREGRT